MKEYANAIVTVIVGFLAFFLYKKQKKDDKRDAAKLILQEIRYAEQQIRNSRTYSPGQTNYYLAEKLLPTNSWYKNIHLFVHDLSETEIDLISKFYAQAAYLDILISKISDFVTSCYWDEKEKSLVLSETLKPSIQLNPNPNPPPSSPEDGQQTGPVFNSVPPRFEQLESRPLTPNIQRVLADVSRKIEFLYNTPAVAKLTCISQKKWYQIF